MGTVTYLEETSEQVEAPPVATAAAPEPNTYGQILKSSALVGGSQMLSILVGILRTKAIALMLGPSGFGLFGIYGSISTLTQTVAGMGVNSSGVRQIAEAAGSGDTNRIAKTSYVLQRVSVFLGVVGAAILVVFSRQISSTTFGSSQHAAAVSGLSLAVMFTLISAGQGALIQGLRRIGDLAAMGVIGAISGTVISIVMVYTLRDRGVVPALIAIALMTAVTSWWYSRKIEVATFRVPMREVLGEASALIKLGFAFMSSGLLTMGSAYVVRITVLRQVGFEATGLYQSAWTLGGLYVGFILQAMGADFYPRLAAQANDNIACNRLVNEQTRVGMLLAAPGVIATLTFAPLVTALFYSSKFGAAVGVLRWICLGTILQVLTWPMGFIIVAKAKQALFIGCELAWTIVSLGLAWVCIRHFGLAGAGIAFFGSYVFHGFLLYAIVGPLSGFRWSADNWRTGAIFLSLIAVVFVLNYILPFAAATVVGSVATLASSIYSVRTLSNLVAFERLPGAVRRVLTLFGLQHRHPATDANSK